MKRLLQPWLLLCGCDALVHGHVISKEVEPPTVIFIPQIEHCGKDCSIAVMIPVFYPESYRVTVEGPDQNGKIARNDLYLEKILTAPGSATSMNAAR